MATLNGGAGDDSIAGTSDNDFYSGSGGNDTFTGGAGNDTLVGNADHDSLSGDGGDDSLVGGTGDDTLRGGEGRDTLIGEEGHDSIEGGDGRDTLGGGDDADTIDGGADDDLIYGDGGEDSLSGGSGNDTIYGGDDADTIDGGAGDDALYGGNGADVFVVTDNGGNDIIKDFNSGQGDIINIDYPGINSFADLQPMLSDDGNFGTLISFTDGSVTQVEFYNFGSASASDFAFSSGPHCFRKGTLIDTVDGPRPIETLRTGDLVETLENGAQPLHHICFHRYRFGPGAHKMKPMRIKAGALGNGAPSGELLVSPQHRIALPQGRPDHLVPVCALRQMRGVSMRPGCRGAQYYHLVFAQHQLVRANGA